jgi:hypothetical protein
MMAMKMPKTCTAGMAEARLEQNAAAEVNEE